jgi:hypothetical protein
MSAYDYSQMPPRNRILLIEYARAFRDVSSGLGSGSEQPSETKEEFQMTKLDGQEDGGGFMNLSRTPSSFISVSCARLSSIA